MSLTNWILLMLVGGFIGWTTNVLAIRLLFKPYKAIPVPLLGFKVQGLIPRRKGEIAKNIGYQIEKELVSMKDILKTFGENQQREDLKIFLKIYLNNMIVERLPGMLRRAMRKPISIFVNDLLNEEGDRIITEMIDYLIEDQSEKLKLADLIEEKINQYPMEQLEEMILMVAKKELRHIERLGGLLGIMIGFFQAWIITLIS
ncbi:Protein of unknown function [Tindallia magadiensis]|uniref:DUF445 domain-containing protein n=1 Tax=Tindallia magadiensis TaxID=69895 RepID=A0A1I3BAS5_9FIRM|nr:DUF445 family protein [Tindallia magadiensis]SFH58811.1 Protein of unknown function [Tindallia magadiensis]